MLVSRDPIPADRQQYPPQASKLADRVKEALEDLAADPLTSGIYLVATPIGNLADITLRALAVLSRADVVYCEDTRHSAKLLQHYSIAAKTLPLHEHNEDREIERVLSEAEAGKRIAIISDAGTPLLSDPGFRLVRTAASRNIPVISIPGPSAVLTALTTSGLPTDAFFFSGFLPPKQAARRTRLAEIAQIPGSLIIFEAPHRVEDALADMADVLGNRAAVVARELTKLHETMTRGTLRALADQFAGSTLKGEIVIVVGPPEPQAVSDDAISVRLDEVLGEMSLKDAAKTIAGELGVPKSRVYALGVKAKDESP
ncbi:MAG: 16S rRNA (cytidine(1402)-2'-O)-methyltransferase [Hyphomicrobium sp.]|uniref:16S rRNA (cytidine(1402)-2'-O)-methyltransferase n=1 Tax=Hyphomicrobium sp. TaxID=82 RepID=UPI003564CFB6